MKHLLPLLALTLAPAALCAQSEVHDYRPGLTAEGLVYYLPSTALRVTLTARRTIHIPGEFCDYAETYLRLKNAPQQPFDTWIITGARIDAYGATDPSQAYTIAIKKGTPLPDVSLAADGRLLAIGTPAPAVPSLPQAGVKRIESGATLNPEDYKTEAILAAGSRSKMAELTANEIFDIRENRSLLTKGQADFMPKDGEQLQLMLQQLDTTEEALLQLFKGTTREEEHTITFDYVPSGEVKQHVLLRFSPAYGAVAPDDLSGDPVYLTITDLHTLPAASAPAPAKGKKPVEELDLRYRVPSRATVALTTYDGTPLCQVEMPLAQLGRVEHLGGELFSKKYTTRVQFAPETGGILKIDSAAR